jgi:ABC-type dipeptide/oligopeptide/nickel transport system permease component
MVRYAFRRILLTVPLVLVAAFLVFTAGRLAPGDPVAARLGQEYDPVAAAALRRQMGLDRPLVVQFAVYLAAVARFDFGESLITPGRRVSAIVADHLPVSLRLTTLAILLAGGVGLGLGVAGAVRAGGAWDRTLQLLILGALSVPNFVVAALLVLLFGVWWGVLPVAGLSHGWRSLVLPVVVLAIPPTAYITRVVRASMVQALREDYVRTARSKGLREARVVLAHALRNAALPIVTQVGLSFGYALTGAFVVELIFNVPGLARVGVEAILQRDYTVIQSVVLVYMGIFIAVNLLVDLSYALFDPRVRY